MATSKQRTAAEEEEALIARATEEREKLFQRYDRGREPGAEIDPWEDPGFEVYHQTDRYGFIHDKRLPQKPNPHEQKAKEIELERVKKWLKMLDKWSTKDAQEKMRRRVYKGIPDKLRSKVWAKLLNLEEVMADKKDVYAKMLRIARTWGTEARQIDSDVNRQFREHLFYRERYSIKQRSLFNVLTAYSIYNMEVGYCQGMSGVAGVLLMYLDEEEAFWALSTLLSDKKYALHGLYIEGFPKLTRFLAHHDKIITKFLPKLKKHFDQFNLDSILYSLKWFFVIFIERIPFSLCLRVWDIFLLEGDRVITAMAYTILRLHRSRILKLRDMDAIVQFIQVQLHKDFGFDEDHVIKALEQSIEELKKAKLDVPPPPGENEFPKRPFGVFKEPSFESQIGRRKSLFTEKEKEVTETVKLKRQNTENEINAEINNNNEGASSKLSGTVIGSNGQLNSVHVAESEDGGSLLGSSRKSLADTSVTSTADLSIFSGGQRSQHTYEEDGHTINNSIHSNILYDQEDANATAEGNILEEEDEESSPGSAYCSLSIVGRPPSRMRITPTPRAVSPQDIVRIYVPPPPPEELYERPTDLRLNSSTAVSSEGRSPESDCRTIIQRTPTELPGSVSTATITSQSMRSLNQQHQQEMQQRRWSREEGANVAIGGGGGAVGLEGTLRDLALYSSQNSLREVEVGSTSSSRRGSMSRKSSIIIESELAADCPHIRISGGGRDSRKNSLTNRHSYGESTGVINVEYEAIVARANAKPKKAPKVMTSFEKLAQMNDTFYFGGSPINDEQTLEKHQKYQQSDDEAFSYSFQAMRGSAGVADPVRGGGGVRGNGRERNGSTKSGNSMERTKCTSDYNIQYKARDELKKSATNETQEKSEGGEKKGKQKRSTNEHSSTDVKEMMKNKKQYDRFFTPDESEEEEDEENSGSVVVAKKKRGSSDVDLGEERKGKRSHHAVGGGKKATAGRKKSGAGLSEDNSSSPSSGSSGASKSLLATPVNETQPLIMMTEDEDAAALLGKESVLISQYNFKHSRGVEQIVRRRPKHFQTDEDEDGYDDEEDDDYGVETNKGTPASSPTYASGSTASSASFGKVSRTTYYPHRTSSYIPINEDCGPPVGVGVDNKIRIRVNEKNK